MNRFDPNTAALLAIACNRKPKQLAWRIRDAKLGRAEHVYFNGTWHRIAAAHAVLLKMKQLSHHTMNTIIKSDLAGFVAEAKKTTGATSVQWDGLAELVGQPEHDRIVGNAPPATTAFGCDCSTDAGYEEAKRRAAAMAARMGY